GEDKPVVLGVGQDPAQSRLGDLQALDRDEEGPAHRAIFARRRSLVAGTCQLLAARVARAGVGPHLSRRPPVAARPQAGMMGEQTTRSGRLPRRPLDDGRWAWRESCVAGRLAGGGGLVGRRRLGFWRRGAVVVVKPLLVALTRRDWRGMANIPAEGPVIIVANHMSHADPLVLAHYVYDSGRWPAFLAKASVFKFPVIGPWLRAVDQIPVYRGTVDAGKALEA